MTSVSRILESSTQQIVLRHDMMPESRICKQTEAVYLNYKDVFQTDVDIACTLCARDYKGFGTGFNYMNGVVEWQKKP